MGYSCTLSFQLPAPQFGQLLPPLARWMSATDIQQLQTLHQQLPTGPSGELCLCLQLPASELPAGIRASFEPPDASGRLAIGCLWSRLSLQGDQLVLHLSPATSELSHFFSESAVIRDILSGIARESAARLLHLDEWGDECCWWPLPG